MLLEVSKTHVIYDTPDVTGLKKKAYKTNLFSSQIGCGADGWSMKVYDCLDGVIHSLLTGKRCLASEKSFRVLDSRCTLIPGNQTLPFC